MKTIYKFGYKIEDESSSWTPTISAILGIELEDREIENGFSKERNWVNTFSKTNVLSKEIVLCGNKLERIKFNFNRYQEYVYITLVFDGKIENFDTLREHIIQKLKFNKKDEKQANTVGFIDDFKIPFKEPDLYQYYIDPEKYNEVLLLANPVFISKEMDCKDKKANSFEHEEHGFKVKYYFEYNNEDSGEYTRIFRNDYIIDDYDEIDKIIEHFTSIFVLFHRSQSHYKELIQIDKSAKVMSAMSNKLSDIWPKERINLFLMNRFFNVLLYNKTFYSVLELSAQMNSIFNYTRVKYQKIEDKYEKQYERVFKNFKYHDIEQVPYYIELLKYLRAPSVHRARLIDRNNDFFEPTDNQMDRLRSDNDSKVNFAIQWITSILSVVIFLWGMATFWYQSMISANNSIVDPVIKELPWMPGKLFLLMSITLIIIIVSVRYFLINSTTSASKEMKEVIKLKKLDIEVVESKIKEYTEGFAGEGIQKLDKHKLLNITEAFKLLTTYIIVNIDNIGNEDEMDKFVKLIKGIQT